MRKFKITGVFIVSLLFAPMSQMSQAATDLSSLPEEAQRAISQLCSPVQYREGATAYRRCVQSEIESVQEGGSSELSKLGFDEKYAVQQFCASSGDSHRSCINNQIASVRNIPAPLMGNIIEDEQYAIQQSCFPAQSTQGLLAYRQCVANEVASLEQLPRIDLNTLSVLNRNALQLRCSANSQSAAAYRQCLAVEFASFTDATPTYLSEATTAPTPAVAATQEAPLNPQASAEVAAIEPISSNSTLPTSNTLPRNIEPQRATQLSTPTTPTSEPVTSTPTVATESVTTDGFSLTQTETRVISKPELVEQVAQVDIDELTRSAEGAAPGDGLINIFSGLAESISDKFSSLTTLGKILAGVVLAIPFLFFAIKRLIMRRGRDQEEDWSSEYQAQPIPGTLNRDGSTEALKARWDDDFLKEDLTQPTTPILAEPEFDFEEDTSFEEEISEVAPATRIIERPSQQISPTPNQRDALWLSGFGDWLDTEPEDERQQHCTEFLIYWMAYGDERYEKGLKERIFTAQNPNQHELIKRWVLKQDVYAFADTINWLKRNSSVTQQEQIIDLLLALLITENNISPNQNVLLRMMVDVFGIGTPALQGRFLEAYAHDLPAFPRADKQSWWLDQSPDATTHWDARQLAKLTDEDQMLSRLGLTDNYSEADVANAFRRASKRCHPDRFSRLGEWEKMLAHRQFEKFEEARDFLLEVSV